MVIKILHAEWHNCYWICHRKFLACQWLPIRPFAVILKAIQISARISLIIHIRGFSGSNSNPSCHAVVWTRHDSDMTVKMLDDTATYLVREMECVWMYVQEKCALRVSQIYQTFESFTYPKWLIHFCSEVTQYTGEIFQ